MADGPDSAEHTTGDDTSGFVLPEIDAAALTKLAKLIPLLGSTNPHEKLTALTLIERQLNTQGMTFTDAGLGLSAFIRALTAVPEPTPIPPPPPPASTPDYAPKPTRGFSPARQGNHAPPPPPPRPTPQPGPTSYTYAPNPSPRPTPAAPQPQKTSWHLVGTATTHYINGVATTRTDAEYVDMCEQLIQKRKYRNAKEKQFLEQQFFNLTSGFIMTAKQLDWFHNIADRI